MSGRAVRIQDWALHRMGWLRPLFTWLVRRRWPLLTLLAVLCALVPQADSNPTDIDVYFLRPALRLVQHGDLTVFTPEIQVGPLCLALIGIGAVASTSLGLSGAVGASTVLALVALAVTVVAIHAVLPAGASRALAASYELCLSVLLIWGCVPLATSYGHIEEMFLALVLVIAAGEAQRGHGARAGLWLAIALSLKLWAVVGLVVLVLSPRVRVAVRAGLVALLGALVTYAPFWWGGHFGTFDFRWTVQQHVPVSYLLGAESLFDFRARFVQVALSCVVGLVVAIRLRRDARALWLVPATVIAVRLLPDPMLLPYYWTGLVACFVLGIAMMSWPPLLRALAGIALTAGVLTSVLMLRDFPQRALLTGLSIGAITVCLACARPRRTGNVDLVRVATPAPSHA